MGSRATEKLKEIEELRAGLEHKLGALEERFPLAGFGRKAAALVAGGSAGGTALAVVLRRFRGGKKKKKRKGGDTPAVAPVTVNVFPKGASWIAAAGIAVWAGAKLFEAYKGRAESAEGGRPAVVTPIPDSRRTGS